MTVRIQNISLSTTVVIFAFILMVLEKRAASAELTSMSRMAQEIVLQESMDSKLRDTFSKMFENSINRSASFSKSLTYECDKNCIGTFSFEYGITSAFLIAVLSDRKFTIDPNPASPLYSLYEPAVYDFREHNRETGMGSRDQMIHTRLSRRRYLADVYRIERELSITNFEKQFPTDILSLSGNFDWILDLRRHRDAPKRIPWLFTTHASDLNRLIHNGLFRIPLKLTEAINNQLIAKVNDRKLVCFHGNNEHAQSEVNTFVKFVGKRFENNTMYFISGIDNLKMFVDKYKSELNDKIVNIEKGEIYRIITGSRRLINQINLDLLISSHVLKLCDTLVISNRPAGILAAHLRRREDNLFCNRVGVIFPCTRRLVAGAFRDKSDISERIDAKFYCVQSQSTECTEKGKKSNLISLRELVR